MGQVPPDKLAARVQIPRAHINARWAWHSLRISVLLEDADGTLRESQLARLTETVSSGSSGETLPQ